MSIILANVPVCCNGRQKFSNTMNNNDKNGKYLLIMFYISIPLIIKRQNFVTIILFLF